LKERGKVILEEGLTPLLNTPDKRVIIEERRQGGSDI